MSKIKSAHTQGQWGACASCSSDFHNIRHITDTDGNTIASVRYVKGFSQEEGLSNARLIAAAPGLLAALLVAEEFMAGFEDDGAQEGMSDKLAQIRTALDKAVV